MATIALQNEMYREAKRKESLVDRMAKYFSENAEIICMGLASMTGQNPLVIHEMFSK